MTSHAVSATRPAGAARRPLRFVARRRNRPGPGARDAVRLRGPAADADTVAHHQSFHLQNAAFLDAVARFFAADLAGDFVPNKIPLPIGMTSTGKQTDTVPPMVSVPLAKVDADGKPVYSRGIEKAERHGRSDRADAQRADGSGRSERRRDSCRRCPRISSRCMTLPGGKDWAAKKARVLSISAGRFEGNAVDPVIRADVAGYRKLLAEWPGRIVMAGAELNEALPFPVTPSTPSRLGRRITPWSMPAAPASPCRTERPRRRWRPCSTP